MNYPPTEQPFQTEFDALENKPWAKPVVTETSVFDVTESGAGLPPADAQSGFYQS